MAMESATRRQFVSGVAALGAAGVLASGAGVALAEEAASSEADAGEASGEVAASEDGVPAGGTATVGTGMGKHGNVHVEVVTDGGKIVRITVLDSRETSGLGDVAMEKLGKLIVDNQTLNVDSVSGATLSSAAFTMAVADALDKAGEDSAEWEKRDHVSEAAHENVPDQVDVVVVGAGGAGFAAAITAANAGKNVLLLEKLGTYGGSTALSGGEFAAPGNWVQQQDPSIEDSPEKLAEDMLVGGGNLGDPDLVNVIANGALDASQWLTFEAGVSWEHDMLFFGGHSVERSIIPTGHTGSEITTKLTTRASNIANLTVLDNMQVTELITTDGAVSGVKAQSTTAGDEYTINCGAVVLTCGGFGANVEMRAQYNPDMGEQFKSTDSVGAQGEGITMAQAIGADVVNMDLIQTYPTCDIETGALLYVGDMRLDDRAIMINKEGKRFVEELDTRDVLSAAVLSQTDGIAYMIFDQAGADATGLLRIHSDEYENLLSRGMITTGDTFEAVAEPFGIDAAALEETVSHWNEMCDAGEDTDFGYRDEMMKIDTPPYYVLVYTPAVHYTMGGLHINTDAQVLDTEGNPIPGLYSAGENAGGKMGNNRLGSTSMADIHVFGRIAGANAAAYVG